MRKRIGDFLLEKGLINDVQTQEIVKHSKRTGLKFGDSAMELGLVKREDLIELFGPNFSVDFFHLDPKFFPPQTADLIPKSTMIKTGALPLGIKTEYRFFRARKYLNVGFLNPADEAAIEEVQEVTKEKFTQSSISGIKIYLVLADQFLDVLHHFFKLEETELRRFPSEEIHETLQMFLGSE